MSIIRDALRLMDTYEIYPNSMFPPSPYYRFLRGLAAAKRPAVSVELGVCGGGGSLHLALGYERGRVLGIDIGNEYPTHIRFIEEHCPNFEFMLADSIQVATKIDAIVDILFIDTIHTYERTMAEWNAWSSLLADGAIVCLDDLNRPGMMDAWNELPKGSIKMTLYRLHPPASPTDGGFGVIQL